MAAMTGDHGKPDSKDPFEHASSRVQAVVASVPADDMVNWGKPNSYQDMEKARPGFFERILGKVTNLEQQLKDISPIYLVRKLAPAVVNTRRRRQNRPAATVANHASRSTASSACR